MQAVCAECSRLMCRAVVLFLVAECAQTTPMIAPLPGDPNFSIDGSVAFFKSGESNPTQHNLPPFSLPSSPPLSPSVPFLPSSAPLPSLCGGFSGAQEQPPSFYACMLLCFGAGTHLHSSCFFPAFSLFPCFALFFFTCSFPCRMHFVMLWGAPCDLSPFVCLGHVRKLLLLGMHFATLSFAFLASLPSAYMCSMFFTYFLVGPLVFLYPARCPYALMTHAIYALYSLYLATPKSRRVFLMLPYHATYMLIICWVMYSQHLATPKSRRIVLMLPCHTLFIVVLQDSLYLTTPKSKRVVFMHS